MNPLIALSASHCTRKRVLLGIERTLAGAALIGLVYCASFGLEMAQAKAESKNSGALRPHSSEAVAKQSTGVYNSRSSDVLGQITIPALGLQAPVTDGVSKLELIRGVGHIPGTAMPGGLGTMALAGHRDTFFRSLRNVSRGMQVSVGDETGVYRYIVDRTSIVTPEQTEVLEIGSEPALVLVTCYPFNFVGAAPKRFIVHARLLSVAPDTR